MSLKAFSQDLAYVHDVGFGTFAERSGPGVLKLLRDAGIRSGLVVDLGCGGGMWARRLTDAGYRVIGIDISRDMIALASACRKAFLKPAHFSTLICPDVLRSPPWGNASTTPLINGIIDQLLRGFSVTHLERCDQEEC